MFIVAKMSHELAKRILPQQTEELNIFNSMTVYAKKDNGHVVEMRWKYVPKNQVTPRGK